MKESSFNGIRCLFTYPERERESFIWIYSSSSTDVQANKRLCVVWSFILGMEMEFIQRVFKVAIDRRLSTR